MTGRLVLLPTSPRVAPGLLAAPAWDVLRSGALVLAAPGPPAQRPTCAAEGVDVGAPLGRRRPRPRGRAAPARHRRDRRRGWSGPTATPSSAWRSARLLESGAAAVELEVLPGSYDLPGARLLDLVAVMDRLRSPGGCPWDAEQTHESLATYLRRGDLRDPRGDRDRRPRPPARGARRPAAAGRLPRADRRRGPGRRRGRSTTSPATSSTSWYAATRTSSAPAPPTTAADVEAGWERQKAAEKGRASAVDGVPMALPALSLATKLVHRAEKNGVHVDPADGDDRGGPADAAGGRGAGRRAGPGVRAAGRRPPVRRPGAGGGVRGGRSRVMCLAVGLT